MFSEAINAKMEVVFLTGNQHDVISLKALGGLEFFNTFEKLFDGYCKKMEQNFDYIYAKKYDNLKSLRLVKRNLTIKFDHTLENGQKILNFVDHFKEYFIFYVTVNSLNWACNPNIFKSHNQHILSYEIDFDLILEKWIQDGCPEKWEIK